MVRVTGSVHGRGVDAVTEVEARIEMGKTQNAGFTLLELMIVVEILAIMLAIAIPSLMRQRVLTNEAAAVQTLHVVCGAQITFNSAMGRYGNLEELSTGSEDGISFMPGTWVEGTIRTQYVYTTENVTASGFIAIARPEEPGVTGVRTYYIDEAGQITWEVVGVG